MPPLEMSPAGPPPPDLADPAVLAAQCDSAAAGMEQQAQASQSGTAMGGHPYPAHFFGHCANLFKILAEKMRVEADKRPKATPESPATPEAPAPHTPAQPDASRGPRRN